MGIKLSYYETELQSAKNVTVLNMSETSLGLFHARKGFERHS